jgi:hypothetical protein
MGSKEIFRNKFNSKLKKKQRKCLDMGKMKKVEGKKNEVREGINNEGKRLIFICRYLTTADVSVFRFRRKVRKMKLYV